MKAYVKSVWQLDCILLLYSRTHLFNTDIRQYGYCRKIKHKSGNIKHIEQIKL